MSLSSELTSSTITYACDNRSARLFAFDTDRYDTVSSTFPDYDIIQAIRDTQPKQNTIKFEHVKGHQDTATNKLTFLETLNVFVDRQAS